MYGLVPLVQNNLAPDLFIQHLYSRCQIPQVHIFLALFCIAKLAKYFVFFTCSYGETWFGEICDSCSSIGLSLVEGSERNVNTQ